MRRALSADELRALRMRAQLLAGERARSVASTVARVGGVQAQAAGPARLAVRARTTGLTAEDVDRAANVDRLVVRTWAMRGTLHMVPAADVRWMVGLLGPVFARAGRRRREQLGLDDRTCERGLAAIEAVLRGSGPLARAQLVERIADKGVRVDPGTQAPAHLVGYAAMRGLLCRGPDVGPDEPSYVLLDDWVGRGSDGSRLDRDEALAELARRYLAGYGPATVRDFLAWSGLPAADGKEAFALISGEIVDVDAAGTAMSALSSTDLDAPDGLGRCPPRLLGLFDTLLLGYRGRDLVLDPAYGKRIQAGGGFVRPAAMVGGRVIGTWRLDRRGKRLAVTVEPFGGLPDVGYDGLRAEAEDIGRFLGGEVTFDVGTAEVPALFALGVVDVVAAGGGDPDGDAGPGLVDLPAGVLFDEVVSAAERGNIAGAGAAAFVVRVCVVQVALGGGAAAGGERTPLVPVAYQAPDRRGWPVAGVAVVAVSVRVGGVAAGGGGDRVAPVVFEVGDRVGQAVGGGLGEGGGAAAAVCA